ncbi:MAG: ArsO family NAD(P)H-dependent flavin-containing monooxygenase [Longimicrobiales bacterium]
MVVVGGGQAALATAWYLRRTGLTYVILDDQAGPGGAWRRGWDSLRLFSPARWSSLPGWLMDGSDETFPHRDEVRDYLAAYERRYELPVERPVRVRAVETPASEGPLQVRTDDGDTFRARAVVSATGTASNPWIPPVPGRDLHEGLQLHSAGYRAPWFHGLAGRRVAIVGGGNSGAQILAEVSREAETLWITDGAPVFMPDHVDGATLFREATERWRARRDGEDVPPPRSLGDIVMVPSVRDARERGVLDRVDPPDRFDRHGPVWDTGRRWPADAVIWCTGVRPALGHLDPLGVRGPDGRIETTGTRAVAEPRLWLVGYGDWTGWASATLIGVGRTARSTVAEIEAALG